MSTAGAVLSPSVGLQTPLRLGRGPSIILPQKQTEVTGTPSLQHTGFLRKGFDLALV